MNLVKELLNLLTEHRQLCAAAQKKKKQVNGFEHVKDFRHVRNPR